MNRYKAILSKKQAVAVIQIFKRNQLSDMAVFLDIETKGQSEIIYQLCLDCPEDSQPRIWAKLLDIAPNLVETDKQAIESISWHFYDDAEE